MEAAAAAINAIFNIGNLQLGAIAPIPSVVLPF
jgi:hypothetical protein